jgi:hypothetical protein
MFTRVGQKKEIVGHKVTDSGGASFGLTARNPSHLSCYMYPHHWITPFVNNTIQ